MEKFVPIFACLVASFDVSAMNVSWGGEGRIFNVLGGNTILVVFGIFWICRELKLLGFFFVKDDEGRKEIVGVKRKSLSGLCG